uniref:Uncharacterized protein n=1 Tax=Oryza rufipogon TaxID=4529 RepID=A0A0E0R0T8_ORYRU
MEGSRGDKETKKEERKSIVTTTLGAGAAAPPPSAVDHPMQVRREPRRHNGRCPMSGTRVGCTWAAGYTTGWSAHRQEAQASPS